MQKMNVLCTLDLKLAPDALAPLKSIADVDHVMADRRQLLQIVGNYDACLIGADVVFDREVLERGRRLKVIASPSTGTDHIDSEFAKRRGIELLVLTIEYDLLDTFSATAECAWGLLIACMRHIPSALQAVREHEWARETFIGRQLSGKTLGVLGVGRLGKMVVEYGKAFRMRVLGCDTKKLHIPGVQQVDFHRLLRESDVISIHLHLSAETRGMLSTREFGEMKDGVIVVNTSRGAIIDENALLMSLESGKVSAAGLDVIDGEWMADIGKHPVVQYVETHDNLLITPHIGGATVESIRDARIFMAKKLTDFLAGM